MAILKFVKVYIYNRVKKMGHIQMVNPKSDGLHIFVQAVGEGVETATPNISMNAVLPLQKLLVPFDKFSRVP